MTAPRLLTAVLVTALGCLLAVGVAWRPGGVPAAAPAGRTAAVADRVAPLAVLTAWDRSRARAWREGDLDLLRRLYAAGSAAGRADRALLAAYDDRGLRVTRLQMQRAEVEVAALAADRVVLVVTERMVGARAVGPSGRVTLPRDGWSRHRVVLRDAAEGWRVVEVRAVSATRPPSPT